MKDIATNFPAIFEKMAASTYYTLIVLLNLAAFGVSIWLSLSVYDTTHELIDTQGDTVQADGQTYEVNGFTLAPWLWIAVSFLVTTYCMFPILLCIMCCNCASIHDEVNISTCMYNTILFCNLLMVGGYIWLIWRANDSDFYAGNSDDVDFITWAYWFPPLIGVLNCGLFSMYMSHVAKAYPNSNPLANASGNGGYDAVSVMPPVHNNGEYVAVQTQPVQSVHM